MLMAANTISKLIAFIQMTALMRHFGPEQYGLWRTSNALPAMLIILTELGVHSYVLREIARDRQNINKYFFSVLICKLALSFAFLASIECVLSVAHYPGRVEVLVRILSVGSVLESYTLFVATIFRAVRFFRYEAICTIILQILLAAVVLLAIQLHLDLLVIAVSFVVAQFFLCGASYAYLFMRIPIQWQGLLGVRELARLVVRSSPFLVLGLVAPFFYDISTLVLSKVSTFEQVEVAPN